MNSSTDPVQSDLERALWAVLQDRAAEQRLSQADVAKRSGLSQASIGRYFRGVRAASVTDAEAVADALVRDCVPVRSRRGVSMGSIAQHHVASFHYMMLHHFAT